MGAGRRLLASIILQSYFFFQRKGKCYLFIRCNLITGSSLFLFGKRNVIVFLLYLFYLIKLFFSHFDVIKSSLKVSFVGCRMLSKIQSKKSFSVTLLLFDIKY